MKRLCFHPHFKRANGIDLLLLWTDSSLQGWVGPWTPHIVSFILKTPHCPRNYLTVCVCVCVLKVPHSTALSGGTFLLIERRENVMNRTDLSICPDVPPQSSVWSSAVLPAINTHTQKKKLPRGAEASHTLMSAGYFANSL